MCANNSSCSFIHSMSRWNALCSKYHRYSFCSIPWSRLSLLLGLSPLCAYNVHNDLSLTFTALQENLLELISRHSNSATRWLTSQILRDHGEKIPQISCIICACKPIIIRTMLPSSAPCSEECLPPWIAVQFSLCTFPSLIIFQPGIPVATLST